MTSLSVFGKNLIKLDVEGEFLVAYSENSKSEKFSLKGVTFLECSNNLLTSLPLFPDGLKVLHCSTNQIVSLPRLPKELITLNCSHNQLTSLPPLPEGLRVLNCSNNCLTELPRSSKQLKSLFCSNNQLTSLPFLPDKLVSLYCSNNPLIYVPFFKIRPLLFVISASLRKEHSWRNYQTGYRLQETKRYLFLILLTEIGIQLDFLD